MRQNPLGRSALTVSAVGLGCNNFGRRLDRAGKRSVIDAALKHGITHLDTADSYGASERLIGELLEGRRRATRLAGRPERLSDAAFDRVEALEAFALERGHTLLELAIAGLASQPGVASVSAGAMSPEQLAANAAAGEWQLGDDDRAAPAAL